MSRRDAVALLLSLAIALPATAADKGAKEPAAKTAPDAKTTPDAKAAPDTKTAPDAKPEVTKAETPPSAGADPSDLHLLGGPWHPGPVYRESVLFTQRTAGLPSATLLFDAES